VGGARPLWQRTPAWLAVALALATVGLFAYQDSFTVPFVFDDEPNIVNNPFVRMTEVDASAISRAATNGPNRRPLVKISFALNYYYGGVEVVGYHVVNILFHLVNGFLVYLLALKLLEITAARTASSVRRRIAAIAALLFVCHPMQVQAVTYIVQRMTSMGTTFGLAAVLCYLQARTSRESARRQAAWLACAGVATVLACMCKENFFALPALAVVCEVLLFPGVLTRMRRHRVAASATVVVLVAGCVLVAAAYWPTIIAGYDQRDFSIGERLLTQPRAVLRYVSLLLWPAPSRFVLYQDYPVSTSLLSPATTLPAIACLVASAAVMLRFRKRRPLIAFAIAWFLCSLVIESSIVPLEMVYDHRLYFPSVLPLILIAYGLDQLARRYRFSAWILAVPLIVFLTAGTLARNEVWNDPLRIHEEAVLASPGDSRAHLNVGAEHYKRGSLDLAQESFRRAVEIDPEQSRAYNNLGDIARDRGDRLRAMQLYEEALRHGQTTVDPLLSLAWLHANNGNARAAEQRLLEAIEMAPNHSKAYVNLGAIYLATGELPLARANLDQAIRLDPNDHIAYAYRARASVAEGRLDDAERDFARALRLHPNDLDYRIEYGDCLRTLGRRQEAIDQYRKALQSEPSNPRAQQGLRGLTGGQQ
jgi:tetratricopeptide (TPR) repeat protein